MVCFTIALAAPERQNFSQVFMTVLWSFLATVVVASATPAQPLLAVSASRKTFEPRTEIRALFANTKKATEHTAAQAQADIVLKTKLPAINLINFDPIHTVKCTGQNIHIEFANHHGAQTALKAYLDLP